jgi:hypothetical protein
MRRAYELEFLDEGLERAAEKVGVNRGTNLRNETAYGIHALGVGRHRASFCVVAEECRGGDSCPPLDGAGLVHLVSGLYFKPPVATVRATA